MLDNQKIAVVLPAYNAALTLKQTYDDIPKQIVDDIILTDDASFDETISLAKSLGIHTLVHDANRGYGANQKTCYRAALERGADIVVMLHPDYQYSPRLVPAMAAMIAYGDYDFILGSRILAQNPTTGGMPIWKYVSNRGLTLFENLVVGYKLSEYHTGLRAYSRELLEVLPLEHNSDGFIFDNQLIVQAMAVGARIGELSCPTRYEADSSSVGFAESVRYGLGVLRTSLQYRRYRQGRARYPYLEIERRLDDAAPIAAKSS